MARPMRIWMPTVRSGSGADIFAVRLADGLRRAGHDPVLEWVDLCYEVAPWLLKRLPMPSGTDIIHAGSIQGFALKREGVPLVVTEHQYLRHPAFLPYSRGLRRAYQRLLIHRYMARSYAVADALVAVSHHCAVAMRADLNRDIEVIHNWVDLNAFTPRLSESPHAPFRLLFVGNPSPWKGADVLAPLARMLGDDFSLNVMGGLRKVYAADALAPTNFHVMASRPSVDMPKAYAEVDAVLVVSRYESFGYVALEAMASGLPVLGFDNTGAREVCANGESALLGPTDDIELLATNCRRLAADSVLWERLGSAGRRRAELQFGETLAIEQYVDVYRRVQGRERAS
jgi:glycosyltransferase involved in cell wall biosynthesis